jgi:hypothetical protein
MGPRHVPFLFREPAATQLVRVYGRERSGWRIDHDDDCAGSAGISRCGSDTIVVCDIERRRKTCHEFRSRASDRGERGLVSFCDTCD